MESKDEIKEIDLKNCACYCFSDILLDEKLCEIVRLNIL